jgi:hypothetical protein
VFQTAQLRPVNPALTFKPFQCSVEIQLAMFFRVQDSIPIAGAVILDVYSRRTFGNSRDCDGLA